MNITEVRVKKIDTGGKMKGVASITFDDSFVVRDIRIIEGQKGLFVAMPSRKTRDGNFRDVAHPINTPTREEIENTILKEFEAINGQASQQVETQDTVAGDDSDVDHDSAGQDNHDDENEETLDSEEEQKEKNVNDIGGTAFGQVSDINIDED